MMPLHQISSTLLPTVTSSKFSDVCTIHSTYKRFSEEIDIFKIHTTITDLERTLDNTEMSISHLQDNTLRKIFNNRITTPIRAKISTFHQKINWATEALLQFVFKPQTLTSSLLPTNKQELRRIIIHNLPTSF